MGTTYDWLVEEPEKSLEKSKTASPSNKRLSPVWKAPEGNDIVTDADYFSTIASREAVYYEDPDWTRFAKQSEQWALGCATEINLLKHPTIGMSVGAALTLIKRYESHPGEASRVCTKLTRDEAVQHYKEEVEHMLIDGLGNRKGKMFPMRKTSHIRKWRMIRNVIVDVVGVPWASKESMGVE